MIDVFSPPPYLGATFNESRMKKKRSKEPTVEERFPNARARAVADAVVDKLDPKLPMTSFLDAWEAAYYGIAKKSPFRGPE